MQKKRVIMLLDNSFRPDMRVLREAEALTQVGISVTIVAWDRDEECVLPEHEISNNIEIVRIPVKTKRHLGVKQIIPYLRFAKQAFQYIKKQNVDVIHCHDLPDLPIGVFVRIYKKLPLIYDAHEIYWIMDSQRYPKFISNLQRIGEILLLRWVNVLITVGQKRVQYYQPHYPREVYLVGNYYDPQEKDLEKGKEFREKHSIPLDAFVVAYAGTLSNIRGIDVIIECANRFRSEGQNVHFVLAGVGSQESSVQEAARRNPLVHFLGWMSDLTGLFSGSDVITYLMRVSHPYAHFNSPNNLYLSIAWKIPLIAIESGEIESVITSGETGILLKKIDCENLHSAIVQLLEECPFYQNIVKNLYTLQEKYSWRLARNNLLAAYKYLDLV